MRLFLAIELPQEAKLKLASQLAKVQKLHRDFRWVPSENYHITLHFFGEVTDPKVLVKGIEEAVYDIPPIYLYSQDVDLFINSKIVIYLNFRKDKNLETIVERLKEKFDSLGTKKFLPHTSIARYRIPSKQQYFVIKKRMHSLDIDIEFQVTKITLFESVLNKGKPIYKKMAEFPLGA